MREHTHTHTTCASYTQKTWPANRSRSVPDSLSITSHRHHRLECLACTVFLSVCACCWSQIRFLRVAIVLHCYEPLFCSIIVQGNLFIVVINSTVNGTVRIEQSAMAYDEHCATIESDQFAQTKPVFTVFQYCLRPPVRHDIMCNLCGCRRRRAHFETSPNVECRCRLRRRQLLCLLCECVRACVRVSMILRVMFVRQLTLVIPPPPRPPVVRMFA